jgi:hypothetical protein
MKFEGDLQRAREFWAWFSAIAQDLASDFENEELLAALDERVRLVRDDLSWEIGPGTSKANRLIISPNLSPELYPLTKAIVSIAPEIGDWEFSPARLPKQWDYVLELKTNAKMINIDVSKWKFVLLKYPAGEIEIVLTGDNLVGTDKEQRDLLAALVLENCLGEAVILEAIDCFEAVEKLDERLGSRARPIQELRSALNLR